MRTRARPHSWQPPAIDKSLTPDRWGVVDRIIAGAGMLSFVILVGGALSHLV